MKKIYYLLLSITAAGFAQHGRELENLANAEKKGAHQRMAALENPNTNNYDVKYHRLEFTVDPADYFISGVVTTHYVAKQDLNSVAFDLMDALEVSSVKQRGTELSFSQSAEELVVNLPATQNMNVLDSLTITYSGAPPATGFGSFVIDEHNGTPVLWTLSEPFGAREWWPCKQDLNDKVDDGIDVYVTAPSAYNVVSNGLQQSSLSNGDGTKTTHYHHGYPIPAYLIAIAVTNYQTYTQQAGLGTVDSPFFPIINYMYPETASANQASLAPMPNIINFYESRVGNYPFRTEKYGNCQFGWGGGMEHTTVSFCTAGNNGAYSRGLIAHELGHQWFGDKVTCGSWKDIWLNEGFATYMNAMVIEHFDGDATFTDYKGGLIDYITSQPDGAVYLTDMEALDVNRIFSTRLTYDKGAMVLNMLRFKIGDTAFFAGLQSYLNDPALAYGYAHTPDLQAHLEATYGASLAEFFNDWVYGQGYPMYIISVHNSTPGHVSVTINQDQSDSSVNFFEMPVPIRLFGSGTQQFDVVLDNVSNGQTFDVQVPFTVSGVEFNPKNDILSTGSNAFLADNAFDALAGVSLYPNPSNAGLHLNIPGSVKVEKVTFFNAIGQMVLETDSQVDWNVAPLASGLYVIKIKTDSGERQLKFIRN